MGTATNLRRGCATNSKSLVKTAFIFAALAAALPTSSLASGAACPARETGTYPWTTGGAVNGDYYAWVYLTIGKDRRPTCAIGENNIHDSDMRFFVCHAFTEQWKPARASDAEPGAVVKRLMVIPGPRHAKAEKEARKKFFAEHPDERPDCYPE